MATRRRFVQITDREINKIKITCVKILKQERQPPGSVLKNDNHQAQARWFSGNIHLDFVSVNIPR